jgi:nitric-oxide synthase
MPNFRIEWKRGEIMDKHPILAACAITRDLPDIDRLAIATGAEFVSAEPGTVILEQGAAAGCAYIVVTGAVQVYMRRPDGDEIVLARLEANDHFGEQAVFAGRRRNASVRAQLPTTLLRLPAKPLIDAYRQQEPLLERMSELGREQMLRNLVRQSALLKNLPIDVFAGLALDRQQFVAGVMIFAEGEPADRVHLIVDGHAEVFRCEEGKPILIARLEPGQCFGEAGVAQHTTRTATVIAGTELTTLSLSADQFRQLLASEPALGDYIGTLQRIYRLSRLGFVTQSHGRLDGHDAISCVYRLPSGGSVVAIRVISAPVFAMRRVSGANAVQRHAWRDVSGEVEVSIEVAGDQLAGLVVNGEWHELETAVDFLLRQQPCTAWQVAVFKATGSLRLEASPSFGADADAVCNCTGVTLGELRQAIARGTTHVDRLGELTGAGAVCGGCRPRLAELLGQRTWTPARITKVTCLSDEIRAIRLEPWFGEFKPAQPGQHVVLEALINGEWVRRSYTLTTPASVQRNGTATYHEITIKRESRGLLSPRLCTREAEGLLLKLSEPQGEFCPPEHGAAPLVYIVAGIGVTPAIAACRALDKLGTNRRITIDYSARSDAELIHAPELSALAAATPALTLRMRRTATEGRLNEATLVGYAAQNPGGIFFVCGPEAFDHFVFETLRQVGVPDESIRVERFTASGAPPVRSGGGTRRKVQPILPKACPRERPYSVLRADQAAPLREEAAAFLGQFFHEHGAAAALAPRLAEVEREIGETGTYTHSYEELAYGAKLAWRNSTRCIGRLFWNGLMVRDLRHLTDEAAMFQALVEHVELATNGGKIRAVASIFAPVPPGGTGPRLWNPQLLRYAGYRNPDAGITGDPANVELTEAIQKLGWTGGHGRFDLLPLVIQLPGRTPRLFELPAESVMEVPLSHPRYPWFAELGLKWYAVPAVSDMQMEIGGITYSMAPFNGWYMGTEIGTRNFGDEYRYDMLPAIAANMRLDTSNDTTLWRDRALIELNLAVLHSFARLGVTMVDHHAATASFFEFAAAEAEAGRPLFGDWSWLVPPISGAATPVFHVDFENISLKPALLTQRPVWI